MDDSMPPDHALLPEGGGHYLYVIDPSGWPGAAEWRAESERKRAEAYRIHRARLTEVIKTAGVADAAMLCEIVYAALFVYPDVESGEPCRCSCHPRLPDGDLHDHGRSCSCTRTKEERAAWWADWQRGMDAFWASPEGQAATEARRRENEELREWLVGDPGVVITEYGGWAPEQWRGTVDGRSFYFRERRDQWRIELDMRPTGRLLRLFTGGDLDDQTAFEQEASLEGDVIAEGTTAAEGYGRTPRQRVEFLTDTIRTCVAQRDCQVHVQELEELELLFGRPVGWCPSCGLRLGFRPEADRPVGP